MAQSLDENDETWRRVFRAELPPNPTVEQERAAAEKASEASEAEMGD